MNREFTFKDQCDAVLTVFQNNPNHLVSLSQLKNRTGFSRREITDSIRALRKIYPICATKVSPGGYWMGDESDVKKLVISLNCAANTMIETANNLKAILESGGIQDER